jgi:hypothetical protein
MISTPVPDSGLGGLKLVIDVEGSAARKRRLRLRAKRTGGGAIIVKNLILKRWGDVDQKLSGEQQEFGRALLIGCGKCEKSVNQCGKRRLIGGQVMVFVPILVGQ